MPTIDIEDHTQLVGFLRNAGHVSADTGVTCRTLAGGVSNKTVLVELSDRRAWVLKQALERLRVRDLWLSDPARIRREAEGLRWLALLAPTGTTTPLVFEAPEENVLAMEAVPFPHENYKTLLLTGGLSRGAALSYATQFGYLLGTIHRRAADEASRVAPAFEDRSFFESLRLDPYYRATAERVPAAAPFLNSLIADTSISRFTLVHGDYSPKNVLVRDERLILLDHEVVHWGDGAFDVGFAMTHLLSKAHHVRERSADYRDAATFFWSAYSDEIATLRWAGELEARAVRHTLACLLARVRGKSPLEYLSDAERDRQGEAVLALLPSPSRSVPQLIADFLARMS